MKVRVLAFLAVAAAVATSARAIDVPAFEGFDANDAGWKGISTADPVDWHATGGPDGSAYISNSAPFTAQPFFIPLRAQVNPADTNGPQNASNGMFAGNWLAEGANKVRFSVRHNVMEPVSFFVRLAPTPNSPAVQVDIVTPVAPNVWTPLEFDLYFENPLLVVGSATPEASYYTTMAQIAHLQIGARKPANFTSTAPFVFDVDSIQVVPEPASAALAGLAALGCTVGLRRRRRS